MPFDIIGRTGPGMRQVEEFGGSVHGKGYFWRRIGRAIVTNGDFTAYVCDSAATRPSSQITLGRLVSILLCGGLQVWVYSHAAGRTMVCL